MTTALVLRLLPLPFPEVATGLKQNGVEAGTQLRLGERFEQGHDEIVEEADLALG